jgi:hypothetical protein
MEGQRRQVPPEAAELALATLVLDHPLLELSARLACRTVRGTGVATVASHSATRYEREAPATGAANRGSFRVICAPAASTTFGLELEMTVRADEHAAVELVSEPFPTAIGVKPAALFGRVDVVKVQRAQATAVSAKDARSTLVLDHPLLDPMPVPLVRATGIADPRRMPLVPVVHVAPAAELADALLTEHAFDRSPRSGRQGFNGHVCGQGERG